VQKCLGSGSSQKKTYPKFGVWVLGKHGRSKHDQRPSCTRRRCAPYGVPGLTVVITEGEKKGATREGESKEESCLSNGERTKKYLVKGGKKG